MGCLADKMMKILRYLKRAASLPPHILVSKILHKFKQMTKAKKNRWIDARYPTYATNFSLSKSLRQFIRPVEISHLPKGIILSLCRHFLNHEFDLLGSGWVRVFHGMDCNGIEGIRYPISLSKNVNEQNRAESERIKRHIDAGYRPIDWHIDFKSGFRWREDLRSVEIRYGHVLGADVKVPWELSRMQHLTMLAWGYALELNRKYIAEFQNQVLDFIASNPPRYGVNWACTMDVGIRIANWLISYDLFRAYKAHFDLEFEKIFFRSVYEHGRHIVAHLEWDPHLRSNHYLANIAGLLFVAAYLPKSTESQSWLEFAIKELQNEEILQFHQDGSNFEGSTSYHRLSTEMIVYATALALELGVTLPQTYLDQIQKMGDFIRDITKPDGTIVQFGDNDSGRFLKILPDQNELDHRYLIRAIRGLKDLTSLFHNRFDERINSSFCAYPDFGLYIQKVDPWFLAMRCGSIGQKGNGGHAHNDQLSFELAVGNLSMIVDPGTYVYTPLPEERRRFRSNTSHNTLTLKGKEQNEDLGLFCMKDRAMAQVLRYGKKIFQGEQRGFGVIHRRTITLDEEFVKGVDTCDGGVKRVCFQFAPGWVLIQQSDRECECVKEDWKVKFDVDNACIKLDQGRYSSSYGRKEVAPLLVLTSEEPSICWRIMKR